MDNSLKPFCHRKNPDVIIHDIFELEDTSQIPETAGAYIFISQNQRFIYPNGSSRVIYIGMATNLRKRIRTHKRQILEVKNLRIVDRDSWWFASKHQYIARFGGKLFCFTIRGKQDEKNLESTLIEGFYDRYHSLPVGNGAVSYKKGK